MAPISERRSGATAVRRTATWLSMIATWWVLAGLLSRTELPSGRLWTEIGVGLGLVVTYGALWAIVRVWSTAAPRRLALRAIATTGTLAVLLVLLELPATVGLVSYASWLHPTAITDAFVLDAELSYRRRRTCHGPGQSGRHHQHMELAASDAQRDQLHDRRARIPQSHHPGRGGLGPAWRFICRRMVCVR